MRKKYPLLLLCFIISSGIALGAKTPKPYTVHYEMTVKSASFGDMGARKLWIKGGKLRWESRSARLPLKLVKNEQGVFLIHPWNKVVAKYPQDSNRGNPYALMPGPAGPPKAFLKAVKAVKQSRQKVDQQLCDVYRYTEPTTKGDCTIWVGVKSGKPVRLMIDGRSKKADTITATYTKFVEGVTISDSLFELPKGYEIRPMPVQKLTSGKTAEQPNRRKPG